MSTSFVTATTTRFLDDLAEGADRAAWKTLDARMRPVLIAAAARMGLGQDEAEEVAQQTLVQVFDGVTRGQFKGGKGKLRRWMTVIARNAARDAIRRRGRAPAGGSGIAEVPDEARVTAILSEEWKRLLLREAMEQIRSSSQFDQRTLRAFELLVLHGVPVAETAAQCEMTEAQVYVAKSRVRARFLEIFQRLTANDEESG